MAYKDEYEVARLHADTAFRAQLDAQFGGDFKLEYHLAPPLLARKKPGSDVPAKMKFGAWMLPAFRMLAPLKVLRGTPLDVFGYTSERRRERAWRDGYIALAEEIARTLGAGNKAQYAALAALPEQVRGFGHVKLRNLDKALAEQARLREALGQQAAA